MDHYYVYRYDCPIRKEPIYIGKGHGRRAYDHLRRTQKKHPFTARLLWLQKQNAEPIISFLHTDLSDGEALALESFYILKLGRKDLGEGPLLNMTDGGEGPSGRKMTPLQLQRLKGNKFAVGYTHTEEAKAQIGLASKGNRHALGYRHSDAAKLKIVNHGKGNKYRQGISHSLEIKKKMSDANSLDYIVTFPDGKQEHVRGMKAFCQLHGLSSGAMCGVLRGVHKQHKGFTAKYV